MALKLKSIHFTNDYYIKKEHPVIVVRITNEKESVYYIEHSAALHRLYCVPNYTMKLYIPITVGTFFGWNVVKQ